MTFNDEIINVSDSSCKPAENSKKKNAVRNGRLFQKAKNTKQDLGKISMAIRHSRMSYGNKRPTDKIIGGLVGDMIEKLGSLLVRAFSRPKYDDMGIVGSKHNPLALGTACSDKTPQLGSMH